MNFLHFIFSKIFIKNFVLAVITFFGLCIIALFSLKSYTHHNESIIVPDFGGLSASKLDTFAASHDLKYIIIDSIYDPKKKKGTVAEQYPPPNSKVKRNRTIYLTMNAVLPEQVQMPKLVDLSLRQAIARLETYGLKVGKIDYVPDIAKNAVIKQRYKGKEIKPGTKIIKGSVIDLVLGEGIKAEKVEVPYIIGLTKDSAVAKLNLASLNIGGEIYDYTIKTKEDSINARVFKQNPQYSTKIFMGSYVDIYLTIDTNKIKIDTALIDNDAIINNVQNDY